MADAESTIRSVLLTITVISSLVVGLPLFIVFHVGHGFKNPKFSIESTTVKAYNLTCDDHLFCIINIGVKAQNPNPKKHTFNFAGIDMEMRKGKHHKLADDALSRFSLGPGGGAVVDVEAVGLRVGLKKKIARELRGDVAAGEGLVNLYMSGSVGSDILRMTCKDVVVDFSRLTPGKVDQKVDCRVSVSRKN